MMSRQTRRALSGRQHGFTMTELVVVVAIIGLMCATTIPFFVSYYQASRLASGAQQLRGLLARGRQLAIARNGTVCVRLPSNNTMQYFPNATCTGAAWVGFGTDGAGNINLPQGVTATSTGNPVFNYLGAAQTVAAYTVTNPTTGSTLTVTIVATGRMTIP